MRSPKQMPGKKGVPHGAPPNRGVKNPGKVFTRLISYIMKHYRIQIITVIICIIGSVLCNLQGTMFMQTLIDEYITPLLTNANPDFSGLFAALCRTDRKNQG